MTNYTGLGVYRPQPPPRRRILLITALAAATIMLASAGTLAFLTQRPPTIHGIARPAAAAATKPRPKPLTPRTPGWQTASSTSYHIAYDVPPDWNARPSDFGVKTADGTRFKVGGIGAATYRDDYCASEYHVRAVAAVASQSDIVDSRARTAPEVASDWAKVVYADYRGQTSSPDVTLKPDRTLKIDDGALDATLAVADVTVHSDNPCAPKTAKVYAVARPNKNTTPTVLVLLTDQGILDAVSGADAMKILTSMRPDQ